MQKKFATLIGLLSVVVSTSLSAMPAKAADPPGRSSDAACQAAFQQSQAATSCRLLGIKFYQPDFCSFAANCTRQDGSDQFNREQIRIEHLPKLWNCDGMLRFNHCG